MKQLFTFLKEHYKIIFRVILFLLTIAIIVYIFPREGKFRYEFQKGRPWMHTTLIAPFDFPIYKSDRQLQDERDSILRNYNPYFVYDSSVLQVQREAFSVSFDAKRNDFLKSDALGKQSNYQKQRFIQNANNFKSFAVEVLNQIYWTGIVESSEITEGLNENDEIIILKNKLADTYEYDKVLTEKKAYESVINHVDEYLVNHQQKVSYPDFYKAINLYEFIEPNIFYDQKTSENVKAEMLANISKTRGMVQAGEKIISQGEIIDSHLFRILESLKYESENRLGSGYFFQIILIGQIIFVFACIAVLFLFLWNFRKEILEHTTKTTFILMLVLIIVLVSRFTTQVLYIIPFALVPIIIKTFYDARLALFIHMITVLIVGFFAPNGFEFIFLNFIAGIVAIFSLTNIYRRGKLFLSAALVFLTYSFVYFGLAITQEGNFSNIELHNFIYFALNGGFVLLAYPLIYIFEKGFGFLSDLTLMELSDTNSKLLRLLAEKAPGTFQHSMQVANLAEEAIFKIGGNPLLVRTGALYHDIGKMVNPAYFIENQRAGFNPHDMHEFDESANIIISHVKDGVELAKKYSLPEPLIDFIRTHHGTTKVQYFYRSYIRKFPDQEVDINKFTYPGPKPFSKETATLMMADSVEAASRSLSDINEEKINQLVESIIESQMKEGQFDNSNITFKDIATIKSIFKQKLVNIYHARIEYPDKDKR
ncbi:MAG: HDIG domain-containing metalloprotein [Bacteroidales bacterium]|nr:HDIG domain-containing metalloprotein [Bacteroidales bacterium]